MNTLSKTEFLNKKPQMHYYATLEATAIRIRDGKLYFLGWTEAAPTYNIMKARREIEIETGMIKQSKSLCDAICCSESYQAPMSTETYTAEKPLEELLSFVDTFTRNGDGSEGCEIIECMAREMKHMYEFMRDGDYIVIEHNK